jgi:hypothetical protein
MMREPFVPENRARGIFFDQDWGSMPGVMPVASGGIHVWHMPALTAIFGDDACFQFGGGTLGTPGATPPARTPIAWRSKPASRRATRAARSSARGARSSPRPRSTRPNCDRDGDLEGNQVRIRHGRQARRRRPSQRLIEEFADRPEETRMPEVQAYKAYHRAARRDLLVPAADDARPLRNRSPI